MIQKQEGNKMKTKYDIESLIETFKKHAKVAEEEYKRLKQEYEEKHRKPYPYDTFCISHALLEICEEIKGIKDNLDFMTHHND